MAHITQENAVHELLNRIPELKAYRQFTEAELSAPTIIFDVFGDFLLNVILSRPEDPVIEKSFNFVNEMMESNNAEVQSLPTIGVFEVLAGSKKGIEFARKFLNNRGKDWFSKIERNFNP